MFFLILTCQDVGISVFDSVDLHFRCFGWVCGTSLFQSLQPIEHIKRSKTSITSMKYFSKKKFYLSFSLPNFTKLPCIHLKIKGCCPHAFFVRSLQTLRSLQPCNNNKCTLHMKIKSFLMQQIWMTFIQESNAL